MLEVAIFSAIVVSAGLLVYLIYQGICVRKSLKRISNLIVHPQYSSDQYNRSMSVSEHDDSHKKFDIPIKEQESTPPPEQTAAEVLFAHDGKANNSPRHGDELSEADLIRERSETKV